jgi:hypothetical protein
MVSAEGIDASGLQRLIILQNSGHSTTVNGWSSEIIQVASFSRKISFVNVF